MEIASLPIWFTTASYITLLAVLAFDIFLAFRRPHVPSTKESVFWVSLYIGLALIFAVLLYFVGGGVTAGQFIASWVTEYSLSIDNLFVFLLIMARFAVPKKNVQEMLMVGILAALVFRAVLIVVGIHLIEQFSWVFYIFGFIILYAALHQIFTGHKEGEEFHDSKFITWLRKHIPITDRYDGMKIKTTINGKRLFTPVLLAFLTLGMTDVVFALDSIPALFAITTSAFLIITANIFALMGLRQLYFLLGSLVDQLVFLKYCIAAV